MYVPQLITLYLENNNDEANISLYENDLERLNPGVDLNDSIIDAYINILKIYLPFELTSRIYIYSTFFFEKLLDNFIHEK